MKQCSACKAWNRPESVYCAECGAPLPAEREKQEPFYVKVKRICGSPVFLVAILLFMVSWRYVLLLLCIAALLCLLKKNI